MVFLPAPAALGEGFGPSLLHDGLTEAVVGLLRGDEVDARVVMLGVIPVEVPGEVGHVNGDRTAKTTPRDVRVSGAG